MVSFVELSWERIRIIHRSSHYDLKLIANRFPDWRTIMNMKEHILSALREQFERWEELLATLSEEQITVSHFDFDWSIKDVMAHLWAWQQISIARMEGGWHNQEPKYPNWIVESSENWEENADRVNAVTFELNHEKSWSEIYQNWKNGFMSFLALGKEISEKDLLDGDRYPWLKGHSLAFILVASYDHHQEHLEKLTDWLGKQVK
jgi:hypothetical protein